MVLAYTNIPKVLDRQLSLRKLQDQISRTSQLFDQKSGTVWVDAPPEPYYPSIYDRDL